MNVARPVWQVRARRFFRDDAVRGRTHADETALLRGLLGGGMGDVCAAPRRCLGDNPRALRKTRRVSAGGR